MNGKMPTHTPSASGRLVKVVTALYVNINRGTSIPEPLLYIDTANMLCIPETQQRLGENVSP